MPGMYPDDRFLEIFGETVKYPGLDPVTKKFTDGDFSDPLIKPSYIPAESINLILDNMTALINHLGGTANNCDAEQLKNVIKNVLETKAPLESPALTGIPTVPEIINIPDKIKDPDTDDLIDWGDQIVSMNTLRNVIIRSVFPKGYIYMSVDPTSPAVRFGGTWTRWGAGRVPMGVGSNEANTITTYGSCAAGTVNRTEAGERGGATAHALTAGEMPRHTHPQSSHNHNQNSHKHQMPGNAANGSGTRPSVGNGGISDNWESYVATATNIATTATNQFTGGSGSAQSASNGIAHNNMMPYETCYMWEKTSEEEEEE
jgi:microcystin-dependent protein